MSDVTNSEGIGEFIAQSKQNAEALKNLRQEFSDGMARLGDRIERIADRTKLNFMPLIAFSAVLLTVCGMVATPIGYFMMRLIDHNAMAVKELDEKLQREFKLSIETATQKTEGVNQQSKERHDEAMAWINQISVKQTKVDDSDREELRQRRMKDAIK